MNNKKWMGRCLLSHFMDKSGIKHYYFLFVCICVLLPIARAILYNTFPYIIQVNLRQSVVYYILVRILMRILGQICLLLGFSYAGEIAAWLIPVGIPASVFGLVLLLIALKTGLVKPDHIGETAQFLTNNMAFFFIPSAVSIVSTYSIIHSVLFKMIIICVVSTLFTFLAAYSGVRAVQMIMLRVSGRKG